MQAMTLADPPQRPQTSISILNTRLSRWAQDIATCRSAGERLTLSEDGKLGALDVRLTLKTEDGAFIYVEYQGRANMETGVIATAPTFQTSDDNYRWLNWVQAVGAGQLGDNGQLVYSLYEVQVST